MEKKTTNKNSKAPFGGYENAINEVYEHMAFWKINLFHLPSNSEGKRFVDELTEVIDCWLSDSPSRTFPLKRCMLLPNLLLQKSSNKA